MKKNFYIKITAKAALRLRKMSYVYIWEQV